MVGLNSVPTAGDEFYVCKDETMARKAAEVAEDAQVRSLRLNASAMILHFGSKQTGFDYNQGRLPSRDFREDALTWA